jgi:hypothetical protein
VFLCVALATTEAIKSCASLVFLQKPSLQSTVSVVKKLPSSVAIGIYSS